MKKKLRAAASAAMAFCMAATIAAGPPVSAAKSYSYLRTDEVSDGLEYTYELYKGANGSGSMSYTYNYTPGGNTLPIVAYGDKLYGMSDVNDVVKYCERQGMTVMAAFNADFFNMSTGVPTGIVVREGRLCSSDGEWNGVGFREDGTAICGAPKLDITFAVNGGQRYPIYAFNKVRDGRGIYLYSSDYSGTTHLSAEGPVVHLKKINSDDYMSINGSISLRVTEAGMTSGESTLNDDTFILTHQKGLDMGIDLTALQRDDIITVYTGTRSAGWEDVYYACGAGDMMVEQSAMTEAALTSTSRGPRTMLGIRNDGSVSILVCDGRDGGTADGLTLREAALRLYNDGCKNVVNLDGGGSSIASVRMPGYESSDVVSNPSDGRPRRCANFILFVNTGDEEEKDEYITVYPKDALVLAGGSIELSARSYNPSYYPGKSYNSGFYVSEGRGEIKGNVLTLSDRGGEVYVGVKQRGLESVDARIISVDEPETMDVVRKGSKTPITSLSLQPGDRVDLDVIVTDGLRTIKSEDEQFDFTVDGNAGEIDEKGVFTAEKMQGAQGTITVSFGNVSRNITVKVGAEPEVLRQFEAGSSYTVTAGEGTTATASVSLSGDYARYGKGSLSLSYGAAMPGTIAYKADTAVSIPSGAGQLTLMARGEGTWYIDFATPSGTVSRLLQMSGEWTFNVIDKPDGATDIVGFHAEAAPDSISGYAYIDQIVAHNGTAQTDIQPPVIEELSRGDMLELMITDNGVYPMSRDNLSVKLDGVLSDDFEYDSASGLFEMYIPDDGMTHKVSVTAGDYFGNLSRFTVEFEGENEGPFGDIDGHWGEDYINYLYNKGVFTADTDFRPSGGATNEMIATIISRYMGIDTNQYANVELPYADLSKVHDWALPHVKALYSLGIMQGGADNEGRVWFYPTDGSTRARVMTVLGRTLSRGYAYNRATYSDMASAPAWASDHISLLTHLGVVNGYGGENNVMPNGSITRAEMAAILYRMY